MLQQQHSGWHLTLPAVCRCLMSSDRQNNEAITRVYVCLGVFLIPPRTFTEVSLEPYRNENPEVMFYDLALEV